MFFTQLFDDFSATRGNVSQDPRHTGFRDELVDERLRKTVWVSREGPLKNDSGHLPVPSGRIFPVRFQRALAIAAARIIRCRPARPRADIAQTETLQVRQAQLARFTNVAKSI